MKKTILLLMFFVTLKTFAQITGSGIANYIPRFTGTTTIGNSLMYQTSNNQIGIGIGTPAARVELRNGCSFTPLDAFNITNETNCAGTSTASFLVLRGYNVANSTYTTRFVIDANVKTGVNVASPVAQLDVQPYTSTVNPLLLHSNTGTSIFTVLNTSNVGINVTTPVGQLDVQASSSSISPLLLHDNSGNTVFSVLNNGNTGVGVANPAATSSTLAIKAQGTNPTFVDLLETSSTVLNNAMIRFIGSTGNPRHYITEDASGDLLIDAGVGGGAANKVKIDAAADVTGNLAVSGTGSITGATTLSSTLGVTGPTTLSSTLGVSGATTLSSTLGVTGIASFATKVRIGTTAPSGTYASYMLGVDGDVVAKRVIVQTTSWADKVFASDYSLKSLGDVENYITKNKHLPEIPSEGEVIEKGIDVSEMNKLLLQKVEELTLYVIAQQKQIDNLEKR